MRPGDVVSTDSFGPSALVTPANAVTLARLLVTPLLMVLVAARGPRWEVFAFWVVLAVSDGLDGWVARRQGTTRSGAFLDPLADKFLVLGALVALVGRRELSWVPVAVLGVREVGISLYRSWAGRRGLSVPARAWAKVKTVAEDVAVGFALLPPTATRHRTIAASVLWVAVVLALWTGGQYLLDGRRVTPSVETRAV